MPNLKFDFSRYVCAGGQSLVRALPLGAPPPCSLTYLSKLFRGDIGRDTHLVSRWSSATTKVS